MYTSASSCASSSPGVGGAEPSRKLRRTGRGDTRPASSLDAATSSSPSWKESALVGDEAVRYAADREYEWVVRDLLELRVTYGDRADSPPPNE